MDVLTQCCDKRLTADDFTYISVLTDDFSPFEGLHSCSNRAWCWRITSTSVLGQFSPWSLRSFLKDRSDQGPN